MFERVKRQRPAPVLAATAAYLALTIAYAWPLPAHLLHGVAHDPGDPIVVSWILWWTTNAVPLTAAWWNAPTFFPASGTFAFSEHLLGLAPLAAPIILVTHNATLAYNVTLLSTYVLCGLGMHFLGYTITRRHDAAFVAGLAYAFAPYRLAQVPHVQVLAAFWAPVCLAALHRYDRRPRLRWAALAAFAWLMQALSNGYFLFFLAVLLLCWLLWFAAGRWSWAQIGVLAGCFAGAAVLIAPLLLGYKHILVDIYGFSRGVAPREYGADIGALLNASPESLLWGWLHAVSKPEGELFPGPTVIALAVFAVLAARPLAAAARLTRTRLWLRRVSAALFLVLLAMALLPVLHGHAHLEIGGIRLVSVTRPDKPLTLAVIAALCWMSTMPMIVVAAGRRAVLPFYTLAAFAMWVFSLGPEPEFFGHRALYRAPYGWLMRLPGFDGLRVPARFWMMALLCLGVLAALAINRLGGRARRYAVAVAAIGLVLDGWPKSFTVIAAPERRPAPAGVAARLDLPMIPENDFLALYQQTLEGVPLINGFSGYEAPHRYPLSVLLDAGDPRALRALAALGPIGVVIDHKLDEDGRSRKLVAEYPGATLAETHAGWSSYRIPARSEPPLVPEPSGEPLRIKTVDAFPGQPHAARAIDGDLNTHWSGGAQRAAADFTIELEQASHVGQLVLDLGGFRTDFPARLEITVSSDGSTWDRVFLDSASLNAYYGALRQPRVIPLVFPLGRDHVRFIRLRQLGWSEHDWSIAEVHVLR
jgi:hypothetical protein